MKLHTLLAITDKRSRRKGRGSGSGRGKTSGRGTKGQNARGKVSLSFEGGALPLIKRLPFQRGKGKNKAVSKKPTVVNIKNIAFISKDDVIDVKALLKNKKISEKKLRRNKYVKLLGEGAVDHFLDISLPISKRAADKIKKVLKK